MAGESCIVCGKPLGKNPKFCSRSCAAKHNNAEKPKRKAGGKCERCSAAMPKGKRFCPTCLIAIEAEKRRKENNVRSWRVFSGGRDEAPIRRVHIRKETVFEIVSKHERLEPSEPVNALIDRVVAVCFSSPPYVRGSALPRYICLLQHLRNFKLDRNWDERLRNKTVGELPLHFLSLALGDWIKSFFAPENHPLLPSYALDAARFLEFHAIGHNSYDSENWRLKPIVSSEGNDRDLFRFLSPTFKKEFTEAMGELQAIVTVPPNSRIVQYQKAIAHGEITLLFAFGRCHLSESRDDYYYVSLDAEDRNAPTYDLMKEFCFTGSVLVSGGSAGPYNRFDADYIGEHLIRDLNELQTASSIGGVGGLIPAEWITDIVELDGFERSKPARAVPVPQWDAEVDQ